MRMILAAASLLLLAACDGGASDTNAVSATNETSNAAGTASSANAAAPADPLAAARRADMIRECSDDVRTEVPEGTDLNAFCGCAVDRMGGETGEREAMEACAAQMGIEPRR